MFGPAAIGLTAFALCLVTTPLIRKIFSLAKLLDHPDETRKLHRKAIPRVGGIAIVFSFAGALALMAVLSSRSGVFVMRDGPLWLVLLPATALVFLTGLIDDVKALKPWQKLLGQTLAAGVAVFFGGRLALPNSPVWLSCGISFLWLLLCTNAFNLIDGVDGLAAGIALFASATTLISAVLGANTALALAAAALCGCLLAFLRYNFPPASIFLGDCGSLTIGFLLGCFALNWTQSIGGKAGIVAPLIMLSIPLLDVILAIGRRFLRRAPLFQGDRHHIHHKILARALTTEKTVLILYGLSGLTAILSLLLSYSQPLLKWAVFSLFCAFAIAGVASLRYIEFSAALRSVFRRSMLRLIKEEIYLDELALALSKATTSDEIWSVVCIACADLQVETIKMTLADRKFSSTMNVDETNLPWSVTAPLGRQGQLSLTRSGAAGQFGLMLAVLERFQLSISQKDLRNENNHAEDPVLPSWSGIYDLVEQ